MAFSELERVNIRKYLGIPRLFINANPLLENAMTALQSQADGGSLPTSDTENTIRLYLTKLATIETQIDSMIVQVAVSEVSNEAKLDAGRGMAILKKHGTDTIQAISNLIGMQPFKPFFYSYGIGERQSFDHPQ